MIVYDNYKSLNVKYGFTKEISLTEKIAAFYPTINGNLSLKVTKKK